MNITIPLADYISALLGCKMESIIDAELATQIQEILGWELLVAIQDTQVDGLKRMIKRSYFELCKQTTKGFATHVENENRDLLLQHYIESMVKMAGGKINRNVFEGLAKNMTTLDLQKFKEMNL